MLQRLDPQATAAVSPLLEGKDHLLLLDAVLAGTAPGYVMVDDPLEPHALFAQGPEGYYLLGDPSAAAFVSDLETEIHQVLLPRLGRDGWWYLTMYYEPEMALAVERLFGPNSVDNPVAPVYTCQRFFSRTGPPGAYEPPADMLLLPTDAVLLSRDDLQGIDRVREWCAGDYLSLDAFLAYGFGVCLVDGGVLAGWCTTDCVVGSRAEVGIHVQAPYRGRGHGTLLANAMVAECARRGIRHVGWHCYEQNLASACTALSAGFVERYAHAFVHVWINPTEGHLMNGNMDLMLGRYEMAARRYERAFASWRGYSPGSPEARPLPSPERQARYHYHAALAHSLAGLQANGLDTAAVLAHLEAALATGNYRQGGTD